MADHLMKNYSRQPVAFVRGAGALLWDTEGREYLDALAGVAVCGLGHAHPDVTRALCEQAGTLVHTSNIYRIPLQEQLAERLCTLSGMDAAFFCNSGAEANEAALKLARLHGRSRNIQAPQVVVMEGSFHGRTLATLSATGSRKVQAGFEPLVQGFVRVPYNDLEAVRSVAANSSSIAAVLVEPVQGEGGINVPDPDYIAGLRKICDEQGWLLMLDEIQTGIARTGTWFAFQHTGVLPDVMTLAKGLGNGMPVGACLARGPAAELFKPGNHGSTFGGNPLAMRAALAVLDVIERDRLIDHAASIGNHMLKEFRNRLAGVAGVEDIRGLGLMLAIELDRPCGELVGRAIEQGLLINVTADRRVRLLPPLIIDRDQADDIVTRVSALVRDFLQQA